MSSAEAPDKALQIKVLSLPKRYKPYQQSLSQIVDKYAAVQDLAKPLIGEVENLFKRLRPITALGVFIRLHNVYPKIVEMINEADKIINDLQDYKSISKDGIFVEFVKELSALLSSFREELFPLIPQDFQERIRQITGSIE